MQRHSKMLQLLVLIGAAWADWTAEELSEILGGSGPAALSVDSPVDVKQIYAAFPSCQATCTLPKPCAPVDSGSCASALTLVDASQTPKQSHDYCSNQNVCCFPELCHVPVKSCSFDAESFVSTIAPMKHNRLPL